jgi:hypothetical protein
LKPTPLKRRGTEAAEEIGSPDAILLSVLSFFLCVSRFCFLLNEKEGKR